MQNVYNVYNLPAGASDFLITCYISFTYKMKEDLKDILSSIIFLICLFGLKWKKYYSNWWSVSLTKSKELSQNKEFLLLDYTKWNTIRFGFFLV